LPNLVGENAALPLVIPKILIGDIGKMPLGPGLRILVLAAGGCRTVPREAR
jgi:hypothetical protein